MNPYALRVAKRMSITKHRRAAMKRRNAVDSEPKSAFSRLLTGLWTFLRMCLR